MEKPIEHAPDANLRSSVTPFLVFD